MWRHITKKICNISINGKKFPHEKLKLRRVGLKLYKNNATKSKIKYELKYTAQFPSASFLGSYKIIIEINFKVNSY